jgi:CRP-like cAMP-binding protein
MLVKRCASKVVSINTGEKAESIFIVLTGRLRSITERAQSSTGNSFEIRGEHGPSESVGELEVLIEAKRPATVHVLCSLLRRSGILRLR